LVCALLVGCASVAPAPGGTPSTGDGADATAGGAGGSSSGSTAAGGSSASSGGGSTSSAGGGSGGGSSSSAGGSGGDGGTGGSPPGDAGDGAVVVTAGSYALNPPKQCDNQFYVPNCTPGDTTTACGGQCTSQNACESTKSGHPDIGFACPRDILLGAEMEQAATDDFGAHPPFHYAVVGHDPDSALDTNGNGGTRSCCQCYQLVFDTPGSDAQARAKDGGSAVPVPPPLIVQAFNTAAGGGKNFDVFMGAGGFGGNNACDPAFTQQTSQSGKYLYTAFPDFGEGNNGGEKAAVIPVCRDSTQLVTTATISAAACQAQVAMDCNTIAAASPTVASETIHSCIASNDPSTLYHLNWDVYAKRIECPTHLAEVTGCKLAPQGLPAANPNVTTAAQAAGDSSFASGYTTTTMQDCCKPTCAYQDNVIQKDAGTAVGLYNSFYTCDSSGTPVTE
jgi:hypothetical protein